MPAKDHRGFLPHPPPPERREEREKALSSAAADGRKVALLVASLIAWEREVEERDNLLYNTVAQAGFSVGVSSRHKNGYFGLAIL
jgi:hypothetical protein